MRPSSSLVLAALLAIGTLACGSSGSQEPAPAPAPSGAAEPATPSANKPWPVKTRQHLDTWLHGFAMLQDDTARIPFFRRGYREQMIVEKNRRGVTTQLDVNRDRLRAGLAARPQLINAQFFPFAVNSWEEIRQFVDFFIRAEGDPRRADNREIQVMIATVGQYFPAKADRDWLQLFMTSLEDEREEFYQLYWLETQRARAATLAATDSVWQLRMRPRLQGYLNNNQLADGDLILSLPLGGEGRTQFGGKQTNVIAVTFPESRDAAAEAAFVFVHEAALRLAAIVVSDNTTPAEKREGVADRYTASAAVLGGLQIIQKSVPEHAEPYARFYLRAAGEPAPATGALAALERAFPLPPVFRQALARQIDISLGGI